MTYYHLFVCATYTDLSFEDELHVTPLENQGRVGNEALERTFRDNYTDSGPDAESMEECCAASGRGTVSYALLGRFLAPSVGPTLICKETSS